MALGGVGAGLAGAEVVGFGGGAAGFDGWVGFAGVALDLVLFRRPDMVDVRKSHTTRTGTAGLPHLRRSLITPIMEMLIIGTYCAMSYAMCRMRNPSAVSLAGGSPKSTCERPGR